MSYLAIVDLGSNSARMVVEELHKDGTYTEIVREKQDTRIAQNMGAELILQEEPMARTIGALRYFQTRYARFEPEVRAITTAAVRTAKNQSEFLARVKSATGITFQVLTGDQEAYYDYLGVQATLKVEAGVILDTGGASVELIAINHAKNMAAVSLPFGAVNLSEQFMLANDVIQSNIEVASEYIVQSYQNLPWLSSQKGQPVILLGGANRSLARMARTRSGEAEINQIHGYEMSYELVMSIFDEIRYMTRADREQVAGLETTRADIIISGLLPLVNLMRLIEAPKVIFSESGVREGLIAETLSQRHD
ncbi:MULTISPECIES: Ppx/GppA phosphatase family protein [Leuconostoc]|uniref:Exopolyphosphatase n=1 Tax=Leuconostoc pseudomesenteroides TaxID=33968 RepID=A0A5B8T253_LEUPS|nr:MULTISPECIES: exopolyphosphatase [Leuconostoc]MCC7668619.1 exopolyphosphatase [Leuconostoc pseudomesenteroides]MCC8440007.1 exopolyphosphatase [Leuconostoc pseudomesenteroides]MCT4388429.1 exopolyphosphatase [Leuconostoc pseudomesenteroides]MDG9733129.1 exopolyphosphatase [Leuconostoc pseudomesenteroides]MDN2450128.1 exopolyphosphatase [Leuconostoc sp. UCMA20149]